MDKNFISMLKKASHTQLELIEMGFIATSIETHLALIVIRCVCNDTNECATVISLLKSEGFLTPGGIGYIKTISGSSALCLEVKINTNK